jgi:mannan endo-1,4-beta-mannosidase
MNGQPRLTLRTAARQAGGATVSADPEGTGRHRQVPSQRFRAPVHRRWPRVAAAIGAVGVAIAAAVIFGVPRIEGPATARPSLPRDGRTPLPTTPATYIGLYPEGVPVSYAGVTGFAKATGVRPDIALYYSGWLEPFQVGFARTATKEGAVPLVQINPMHVSLGAIAAGKYDSYLTSYAEGVRAYRGPVIVGFGHEMNGNWYSWGYQHTSPAVFVAAWRHIVDLFRAVGVRNVTWMWTVNIIHSRANVPPPRPWWPGSSYVTWVGIDGYYYKSSNTFATLFGPTIAAVRTLTHDPILIAETAVAPAAGQSAKIADLFGGIHLYGLLGFVWFNANRNENWRLTSPAGITAFHRAAAAYHRSAS